MKYGPCTFVLTAVALLFSACVISTDIRINSDGSGHVKTQYVSKEYLTTGKQIAAYQDTFFSCSEITQLKLVNDSFNVEFEIRTIDSLGNYLYEGFTKDYLRFHYSNDTLTITEADGVGIPDKHKYDCCLFVISIDSDRKIKSVRSDNNIVKHKRNTVWIEKKARHIKNGKKKIHAVIVYE